MSKSSGRETILALLGQVPLAERGEPVWRELLWVLQDRPKPKEHPMLLPDYCYHILEKLRLTVFKGYPSLSETVSCTDEAALAQVKTYAEASQCVELDWYRFGKVISLPIRAARLFELEVGNLLEKEGLSNLSPEDEKFVEDIVGRQSLEDAFGRLAVARSTEPPAPGPVGSLTEAALAQETMWSKIAHQWGPGAMSEFKRGISDGLKEFIDASGELAGQTTRTWNYIFFLLAWPEIKEMLERQPRPNRTEVFAWLRVYQEAGLVTFPTIEDFRDFCEDIGLKFAGRPVKKSK